MVYEHISVLPNEAIKYLNPQGGFFIDCTFGGGGHTKRILTAHLDNTVLALDCDKIALENGKRNLQKFKNRLDFYHSNFRNIGNLPDDKIQGRQVQGILMDIGVSSHHFDETSRGFSFKNDAPLDMRMNREQELTAAIILNTWSEEELNHIICNYGEEKHHKIIVDAIIRYRKQRPWKTTLEFTTMLDKVLRRWHKSDLPAPTKTFQALRITVNDEINALQQGLESSFELLAIGGRLIVITFHSLEDKLVKKYFRNLSTIINNNDPFAANRHQLATGTLLTRKVTTATQEEIKYNSRASSAKLRAIQKN